MSRYGLVDVITTKVALNNIRKKNTRKNFVQMRVIMGIKTKRKIKLKRHLQEHKVEVSAISIFPSKIIEERVLKVISSD